MYITESELLNTAHRELLQSEDTLLVSGRPLTHWSDSKDSFFDQCVEVIRMPLSVRLVTIDYIDPQLNCHLDNQFTGEFISIIGENPETGDEYRFAIKEELGFCLEAVCRYGMID